MDLRSLKRDGDYPEFSLWEIDEWYFRGMSDFNYPARRFICDYWPNNISLEQSFGEIEDALLDRWDAMTILEESSFNNMLITHPPCRAVKVQPDVRLFDETYCSWKEGVEVKDGKFGGCLGEFLVAASRMSAKQRVFSDSVDFLERKNSSEVVGGEWWRVCPEHTVDYMTGWEMLNMLDTDIGEVDLDDFT